MASVFWDIKELIVIEVCGDGNIFNFQVYIAILQRPKRCIYQFWQKQKM